MTERTHFVRLLTNEQIGKMVDLLAEFDPRSEVTEDYMRVFAPDGDAVFEVIYCDGPRHVCRLHREVFDEDSAQGEVA